MEKKFHKNANLITTVSDPWNNTLTLTTSTTVKTIYNGYFPEDFDELQNRERNKSNTYTIVYSGNIHYPQDPTPLFAAVSQIKNKDISLYNRIRIQFAGKTSNVSGIAKKYGVSEIYEYLGFISRKKSLQLQYDASVVLFMDSWNVEGMLPAKIFEYFYLSRKIIALGRNDSSTAIELIKKTNTGIYLGENIDLIAEHLITCLNNPKEDVYKKNDACISEFSRENQANKLLNYILQL